MSTTLSPPIVPGNHPRPGGENIESNAVSNVARNAIEAQYEDAETQEIARPVVTDPDSAEGAAATASEVKVTPRPARPPHMLPLTILAALAVYYTLYAARAILLPITLAFLIALTLRPIVRQLRKLRVPDSFGAALVLGVLVCLIVAGTLRLLAPAEEWMRMAPEKFIQVKDKLGPLLDRISGLAKTSETVTGLANATSVAQAPVAVEIRQSGLSTNIAVASFTGNFLGMASLVIALVYFILVSGDRLLSNVISLLDFFSEKRKLVELVYEVERGIASYLLMVTCINAGLGLATFFVFWMVGVPHAGLWGLVAFVFNYVPIFGPICTFLMYCIVCIVSFDSLAYAMIAPLAFAALATIEGNVITPMVMGRSMSLNPIVVFLSLIFWGWMWGLGGAVLAVPLVATLKIACEKFERTRPIAVLLGD